MEEKIKVIDRVTDRVGLETLDSIALADRFNRWMYETVSQGMAGEILEIGSGIGNISAYFVENRHSVSLSDMRREYCDFLYQKFKGQSNLKSVYQIDVVDPNFDNKQ